MTTMNVRAWEVREGDLIDRQEVVDIEPGGTQIRLELSGGGRPGRVLYLDPDATVEVALIS